MEQEKSLDRDQSVLIFTPHADVFSFVFCFSVFSWYAQLHSRSSCRGSQLLQDRFYCSSRERKGSKAWKISHTVEPDGFTEGSFP